MPEDYPAQVAAYLSKIGSVEVLPIQLTGHARYNRRLLQTRQSPLAPPLSNPYAASIPSIKPGGQTHMHTGSCLCKAVTFTYDGTLEAPRYCHCENCRKFSGSSPAAWVMAQAARLNAKHANPLIKYNSGQGIRCSCGICGTPVWFESIEFPQIIGLPLGVFDSGEIPQPQMHLWWDSKPAWWHTHDQLTTYRYGPDSDILST